MKDFIINNAPIISLLIFFSIFCLVIIHLLRPKTKKDCEKYSKIPLKDNEK